MSVFPSFTATAPVFVGPLQHTCSFNNNTNTKFTFGEYDTTHKNVWCDKCKMKPIIGTRYKCGNCVDFDLCSNCKKTSLHDGNHIFMVINKPIPHVFSKPLLPEMYGKGIYMCGKETEETKLGNSFAF